MKLGNLQLAGNREQATDEERGDEEFLEQFRMRAGSVKNYFVILLIHKALIVRVQICQHLIKRIVPFCRNFTSHHGSAFLNRGDGFGIRYQCPACGITVLGAERAVVLNSGFRSRGKGENNRPGWHFTRKGNPAVSRYVYSLCHCHIINITQKAA